VGVLSLYSSNKDAYSEEHERILEVIARQVSGTVREAHAAESARKRSFKDQTTGLPNLNHLIEFLQAQLADADRRHPFCLVVVKFGGRDVVPTTEETEAAMATVKRNLRPADLLFRSGLDELAGLLLNTERASADTIASRLTTALIQLRGSGTISSFQIGVACGPADADNWEHLLGFARERAAGADGSAPRAIH
jgi:GGDEF domain-containing protein